MGTRLTDCYGTPTRSLQSIVLLHHLYLFGVMMQQAMSDYHHITRSYRQRVVLSWRLHLPVLVFRAACRLCRHTQRTPAQYNYNRGSSSRCRIAPIQNSEIRGTDWNLCVGSRTETEDFNRFLLMPSKTVFNAES